MEEIQQKADSTCPRGEVNRCKLMERNRVRLPNSEKCGSCGALLMVSLFHEAETED